MRGRIIVLVSACVAACSGGDTQDSHGSGGAAGGGQSSIGGGSGWNAGGSGGSTGGSAGSGGGAAGSSAGSGGASSLSCGELAGQMGWTTASCEWNGNGACNGQGTPTYDCDFCCGGGGGSGGGTSGGGGSGGSTGSGKFGYPVGDKSTSPAGGWTVWQVLSHYWDIYGGRHLAQDISINGGVAAVGAPVYSVADGTVLFAKPNSSAYKNVILIQHDVGDGTSVCSFYGHITGMLVSAGQQVKRGDQIASVIDWAQAVSGGSSGNSHLHYVLVSQALCDKAKNSGTGSGICGYDKGGPSALNRYDVVGEPYYYTSVSDDCGSSTVSNGFISPTKFIDDHHF